MEIYRKQKKYDVSKTTGISCGSGTAAIANSKEQKLVVTICWEHPKLYVKRCCTIQIRFVSLRFSGVGNKPIPKTCLFLLWKSNIASYAGYRSRL